jgi:hypothetical protein
MFPLSTTDRSMAITIQSSNPIINHQITITMRVLALVATLVGLSSISASMDRHFPRSSLPAHWSALNVKVEPTQRLQLRVALFPKNAQALENTLLGVATPGSKSFRQYLKKEEIASIVGRAEDELSALKTFFAAHGMQLTSVQLERFSPIRPNRVGDHCNRQPTHTHTYNQTTICRPYRPGTTTLYRSATS